MNTSQIKNFAAQSRNILKTGVIQRIQVLGFDANGNLTKGEPTRIEIQGGATLFNGEVLDGAFYDRWMSLRHRIQEKGVKEVYEEAAYTWFNRLVAIRIMQKNGFIDPVLAYTNEQTRIPRIVSEARAGRVGKMSPADREKLRELMGDDARINEQFALLIDNFCRNNAVIFNCFGGIEEYISLLLPDNILAPGGFIDLLNHTSYITDEDFKQSELIGWLYQFYISEKKDEVFDGFKKGKKAEAEDIPAATQIFTPNWIVKYMVQNTIGRIYLDNNPWATDIKDSMKYLVEPSEPTPTDAVLKLESLEDYKLLDNACGSGHILVEAFGLFYRMYLEEGYSSRNAIENILSKNLLGIDLDTRAKQLATFALLMTAAKVDLSFLDCKVMPRVLDMPSHRFSKPIYELLREFYMGEDRTVMDETMRAFELLELADNLGSIMKFNLSAKTRKEMALRYKEWTEVKSDSAVKEILHSVDLVLALTEKYVSIVMNPPYMGFDKFNDKLKVYVVENYPIGRQDFFTIFMDVASNLLYKFGLYGMINMQSWMYLASFEDFRNELFTHSIIKSMLHLGPRTFDELSGEVVQNTAFIIQKNYKTGSKGVYYRLVEGTDCSDKQRIFEEALNGDNADIFFDGVSQDDFSIISGAPVLYDLPKGAYKCFTNDTIEAYCLSNGQNITGDNGKFLRMLWEVDCNKVRKDYWSLCARGGGFRRYYGNVDNLILWTPDACEHYKKDKIARIISPDLRFRLGITWSYVCSGRPSFRILNDNELFEKAGTSVFVKEEKNLYSLLGLVNSKVASFIYYKLAPSTKLQVHDMFQLPVVKKTLEDSTIKVLTKQLIGLSKLDWDAHETSWDFKENELVRVYKENHNEGVFMDANRLENIVAMYKEFWTGQFNHLRDNEEELNRQFIEIYGLQDELTPDVPLNEITILQQGEITVDDTQVVWHNDVLAKQLISYAVGCMMGRYRLDRPGLHIAYPNPSAEDIMAYDFQGDKFAIDDDGIIPLLPRDCPFDDNAYNRLVKFIRQVFGESFLNENLNFLEASLGRTLEDYFVKDFWKDHKKMYSNRPIYWLFSSKKGAFQCLTYMHRMNPYTAEAVRSKYLLPYIDFLKNKIAVDLERVSSLSTIERRNLDKMQKALDESLEYEEILHDVADRQIRFDLDDGVVVNYAKFGDVLAKIK
jgi:hypothetical protein